MVLIIDNYDSFTWNLYDYASQCGIECKTFRNDEISLTEIEQINPEGFIFSPGPRKPSDHPLLFRILEKYAAQKPILGICLGYQAIGEFYGAKLVKASKPMHGKVSIIEHNGHEMFSDIPSPLKVARYHSLALKGLGKIPLMVTAKTLEGEPMSFAHQEKPIWGIQFHPEAILTECGLQMLANWVKIIMS
jgi:anthranilate synthase/aminodeoxychorismate synthase-like glutamine amidotransferase